MNNFYLKCGIASCITVLTALMLVNSAAAKTITVDDSGGADYVRIQDAINSASNGDTIMVYSGTYYETVNITKRLILQGVNNGGGKPVINANQSFAISLSSGNSTLEGLAVNSTRYQRAGIFVRSNNNIIRNNTALNNEDGFFLIFSSNNMLSGNTASNNSNGISLRSSSNNTLSGNNVLNNSNGILLSSSNNNTLSSNSVMNNGKGIYLDGSNNTLDGNRIENNNIIGIELAFFGNIRFINNIMIENRNNFLIGKCDLDSNSQIDNSNLVNGKPIYYIKGARDTIYDSTINAGAFYCINCVNVTIKDMNLKTNGQGISFCNTNHSKIQNVTVSRNGIGISLVLSNNNTLSSNKVLKNNGGIFISYFSNNNILSDNDVSNNGNGIEVFSNNNMLNRNNVSTNSIGIFLLSSSNNMVSSNSVTNNYDVGISLSGILQSPNNNIVYNNFFNNSYNLRNDVSGNSPNRWNITKTLGTNIIGGPYIGGNVWANLSGTGFSQTCADTDRDEICDSSYKLDNYYVDQLPLAYKPSYYGHGLNVKAIAVIPDETKEALTARQTPKEGSTENAAGFEVVLVIVTLSTIYLLGRKRG